MLAPQSSKILGQSYKMPTLLSESMVIAPQLNMNWNNNACMLPMSQGGKAGVCMKSTGTECACATWQKSQIFVYFSVVSLFETFYIYGSWEGSDSIKNSHRAWEHVPL